jgi:microcystin-dependent protein
MGNGPISWSTTAAANATVDSSVNFAEGQAPSSLNDSCRALMAGVAKFRDDMAGTITTGGTATAYTASSNAGYSLTSGFPIAFVPHATNGATVTLNVDSLGAKPLRSAPGVELPAGVLVLGTPYAATYYTSNSGEWILRGLYGNPYNIPLGSGIDFWGSTAPNSSFVFPYGQAISRSTYAPLFSLFSTTYGSGDGSTTFNLPDKRGRVSAGLDNMGGTQASRLTGVTMTPAGTILGSTGGEQTHTLITAELPVVTQTFTGAAMTAGLSTLSSVLQSTGVQMQSGASSFGGSVIGSGFRTDSFTPAGTISSFGSGNAHADLQPTIVCNYILRIS